MSPASRRRAASGSPRRFGVSRARAATFLALVVASACARPSFARGARRDDESWYRADVEEFALDGPDAVQAHVASALRENRERPDYDAAVNPILPGGRVRDVAVAVAAARGDIRRPVSSAGLLGIGAGDGDGDGDDDDDDGARAPSPARPDDADDEASDEADDESEESFDGAAWGRRDVLGGMIVDDDDDDAGAPEGTPEGTQHRGRSLARSTRTRSTSALELARRVRASRCGSAIASGAVAAAGAMPGDPREWAAAEDEETGLGVTEVPWMIAMEVGERRERERMGRIARASSQTGGANGGANGGARDESNSAVSSPHATDDREAELEARYSDLLRWVTRKGGVVGVGVNVTRVVGKPGDGWGFVAADGVSDDDGADGSNRDEAEAVTAVSPGDVVARVPIALALSHVAARTYRVDDAPVGDLLRRLFDQAPEYALCMMLLHERFKLVHGLDSPWGPYVRTLSHVEPSVKVLRELRGTYADEARREWDTRVRAAHEWITDTGCGGALRSMCQRKPGRHGAGSGSFNRDDVRWALGVVRSRAVWIARRFGSGGGGADSGSGGIESRRRFPALVPLLDLLPHDGNAGGSTTLGVDNVITVTSGSSFAANAEIAINRGTNCTDAEQLLAYHALAPGVNRHNAVRLNLPGAEIATAGVIRKVELLRRWRREMAMPPRGADLWRDARGLGLYGDGDEEEMRAMGDAARENAQSKRRRLAALAAKGEGGGRSGGAMTIEEELLLTDEARDPAEAAAKAAARIGVDVKDLLELDSQWDDDEDDDGEAYALYSAPNPDHPGGDSPALDHHRRSLARLAAQTAAAAAYADVSGGADYAGTRPEALGSGRNGNPTGGSSGGADVNETRSRRGGADLEARSDGGNATRAALRSARAFFERGAPPPRGLDPLDLFLLRKGRLMSECGGVKDFVITAAGASDALMCATRVLLANETEVKALEGGGSDPHWSGDRMESASEIERLKALGLMHEPFQPSRPLSFTNELAAIRRIASAATNILAGYGTTEEEDLERLRDVDPVVLGLLGYDDDRYSDRYGDRFGDGERGVWSGDSDDDDSNSSSSERASIPRERPKGFPARVPGGVLASAVALRVRERRMLRSAVLALRDRAETLRDEDVDIFQVEEKERRRIERDAFERERAERIRELSRTFLEREVLASIDVDVVQPADSIGADDKSHDENAHPKRQTTTVTKTVKVRAGDDLESIVREFMAANSIDQSNDDAFASLKRTLLERVERGAAERRVANRRVGRCAVIVPDGRKVVVAPRFGEELTDVVRGFAEAFDVPLPLVPALATRVNASLAKRAERRTLLTLNVVAPDGRSELEFDVVDGEQHDLLESAREWALAYAVHPGAAVQVADAAFQALPPVVVAFPVDVPGRARKQLAIRDVDEASIRRTCLAFCEANDLGGGDATVDALTRGAMSRINPGAVLVDADRRDRS